MVHAALLLLMLEAVTTRTSLNHQPEAQHPKSSAIHKLAGRLPHLPNCCVRQPTLGASKRSERCVVERSRLTWADGDLDYGVRPEAFAVTGMMLCVPVTDAPFDLAEKIEAALL